MPRLLSTIGFEIQTDMVALKGDRWRQVYYAAVPYLEAMQSLGNMSDCYGQDSAETIVVYLLGNLQQWRGDKAREIKAELRQMAGLK